MVSFRYKELDALRGLAALLVVFFHFVRNRPEYNHILKLGTTGVDLFFIISGFVIMMSVQNISRGLEFIINRISRLYPTYWASVTFTFLLIVLGTVSQGSFNIKNDLVKFLGNLTMFQYYFKIPDLDGPYWTMIIEMLFYISVLIMLKMKALKYLNPIGVITCAVVFLLTRYYYDLGAVKSVMYWFPLFQFLPLFFAGTVFYRVHTEKTNLIFNYVIVIFCLLCQIALFPYAGKSRVFISLPGYCLMLTLYFTLFVMFVNGKLKFVVNKLTLFLGKISFALYLIHQYISLALIIPIFYDQLKINFWVVALLIDLPIVIAIASLITYKIEQPYSGRMRKYLYAALIAPQKTPRRRPHKGSHSLS